MNKLKIFQNNIINNNKVIPFNVKLSDYRSRYEVPVSKEWKYTIYNFYKNNIKNIPVNNINLNKILFSYFNLFFLPKFLNTKVMSKKRRSSLLRRIYVSKVEVKENNNKAIITLYVINTERTRMINRYFKKELIKKIQILLNQFILYIVKDFRIFENKKINVNIWKNYRIFLENINYKKNFKYTILKEDLLVFYLEKIKINLNKWSIIHNFFVIKNYELNKFLWFYFFEAKKIYFFQLLYKLKFKYSIHESYQEIKIKSKIAELKKKFEEWQWLMFDLKDVLNQKIKKNLFDMNIFKIQLKKDKKFVYPYKLYEKKFNKTFSYLYKLNLYLSKILKKKIVFNIINLTSIVFNSDIFTKSLALKLKKKKYFSVFKSMRYILNKAVLPEVNYLIERKNLKKEKNKSLIDNKFKKNNLANNLELLNIFIKDIQVRKLFYSYKEWTNYEKYLKESIFNSIKYKNLGGLKLVVKGRLTRRYRADRAVYRVKWIGGLKNIESSFNKLSSTLYRGFSKPNISYSMINSKRRIGAFAAKGWLSGK